MTRNHTAIRVCPINENNADNWVLVERPWVGCEIILAFALDEAPRSHS